MSKLSLGESLMLGAFCCFCSWLAGTLPLLILFGFNPGGSEVKDLLWRMSAYIYLGLEGGLLLGLVLERLDGSPRWLRYLGAMAALPVVSLVIGICLLAALG